MLKERQSWQQRRQTILDDDDEEDGESEQEDEGEDNDNDKRPAISEF